MRGVSILGATGSVGVNSLKVLQQFPDRFRVVGLSAGRRIEALKEQIRSFRPVVVSVAEPSAAVEIRREFPGIEVGSGIEGMIAVATHERCDFLMSATVGAVGLQPTLRALEAGKAVGLANKETLVMAGELMTAAVRSSGAQLLPVDSEHNAIHQCLAGREQPVKRIWLTASGGPFRRASLEEMRDATAVQALKHPTWEMGPKITIDSATMMNKGLEVIEARWLFSLLPEQIRIVVHPQSCIHSMVEFEDGSLLAQLGATDMRLPIQYALTYPERLPTELPPLDLESALTLEFHPPDLTRFKSLRLAYQALETGGCAPAVLNAANEVAVEAFLEERIGFLAIPELIEETLSRHVEQNTPATELEAVLEADAWARRQAKDQLSSFSALDRAKA